MLNVYHSIIEFYAPKKMDNKRMKLETFCLSDELIQMLFVLP